MLQYPTCRHVHETGAYCGSPALRDQKYCHYHLHERGRRLRRARALRDNLPFRLEIQSLDSLYAIRTAITDIAQALAAGRLDPLIAGRLLYAIQQASSVTRRIEQAEAAQAKAMQEAPHLGVTPGSPDDAARVQEFPDFERRFGLAPDADIDTEIAKTLQRADEQAELRQADAPPPAPPSVRPGSAAERLYREETYQMMGLQIKNLRAQLRAKAELERHEFEKMKKEPQSATPPPESRVTSA